MEQDQIVHLVQAAYEKDLADKVSNCIRHNSKQGNQKLDLFF